MKVVFIDAKNKELIFSILLIKGVVLKMSMDFSASFALVIEQEKIEKMNLVTFRKLLRGLKLHNVSLSNFAHSYSVEDVIYNEEGEELSKDSMDEIYELFEDFKEEFKNSTGVGIDLGYHNQEEQGSCYDDIDGVFFALNFSDVYEMTPEAKHLQKKTGFEMKYFVTFG